MKFYQSNAREVMKSKGWEKISESKRLLEELLEFCVVSKYVSNSKGELTDARDEEGPRKGSPTGGDAGEELAPATGGFVWDRWGGS